MSDIRQEWRELRKKNGDFLCHLDGEMAKLEKKQVELKRRDQLQNLVDAGAFAMQFVAPPPFNCCQDDRDILKALNKAQADRIKYLEDQITAYKEQQRVDLAVKKDLDEKLDKAAADYKALWIENEDLKRQLAGVKAQCENTIENRRKISELSKKVINLREENAELQKKLNAAEKESNDLFSLYDQAATEAHQAKVAKDRIGYSNSCMQSKIAKQANEIKRLTEENERLKHDNKVLAEGLSDQTKRAIDLMSARETLKREIETLHGALDIAAKDADANFERGKIKGMAEIWKELVDCYDGRPMIENNKIFGYNNIGDILMNLSPTWFMNRARKYHEQKEKEDRDIKIGDEVEIFDQFCPDDDPHSDIGIVTAVDEDHKCFAVVGPKFEGCFDLTDIDAGNARKTGKHYDAIPIDYFT